MNVQGLNFQLSLGEDRTRQCKEDIRSADSLASRMSALAEWPEIDFKNDENSDLFTTAIARPYTEESSGKSSGKSSVKLLSRTSAAIVQSLQSNPKLTIPSLADELDLTERAVEKQIKALREAGIIRRMGPAKGGYWEVLEK